MIQILPKVAYAKIENLMKQKTIFHIIWICSANVFHLTHFKVSSRTVLEQYRELTVELNVYRIKLVLLCSHHQTFHDSSAIEIILKIWVFFFSLCGVCLTLT